MRFGANNRLFIGVQAAMDNGVDKNSVRSSCSLELLATNFILTPAYCCGSFCDCYSLSNLPENNRNNMKIIKFFKKS